LTNAPRGRPLRIGSRPSRLALAQAEIVRSRLAAIAPRLECEIVPIRTSGDRMTSASLAKVGGKGLFVKELEQALRERQIDIAVHSMKDLPAGLAPGLTIAAVPEREDPRDALITRLPGGLHALPRGARVGTSSSRRHFELARLRPDLTVSPLRGNIDTRLERLAPGELDAIILALAGLRRLGRLEGLNLQELDEGDFVPAGGQGALAIEALLSPPIGGSDEAADALGQLNDVRASAETAAERSFLAAIGASCVSPVGVRAKLEDGKLGLRARLFSIDGSRELADSIEEPSDLSSGSARRAGARLAERMLAHGARELIGATN
jgi:hydroxymethylbilane synthase